MVTNLAVNFMVSLISFLWYFILWYLSSNSVMNLAFKCLIWWNIYIAESFWIGINCVQKFFITICNPFQLIISLLFNQNPKIIYSFCGTSYCNLYIRQTQSLLILHHISETGRGTNTTIQVKGFKNPNRKYLLSVFDVSGLRTVLMGGSGAELAKEMGLFCLECGIEEETLIWVPGGGYRDLERNCCILTKTGEE